MTAQDKKDRRQARHEIQAQLKRPVTRRLGLYSTGGQMRSAVKVLTDRYIREVLNPAVTAELSPGQSNTEPRG
jgi:hypothetical protein